MNRPIRAVAAVDRIGILRILLAFIAGVATLVYQLVMLRIANRYFGAESQTLASIVCVSLVGLAVGAYWSGRYSRRIQNPLRFLSCVLAAAAVYQTIIWALNSQLGTLIGDNVASDGLGRLIFSSTVALPTNLLLGTVLPILSEDADRAGHGRAFAPVYAAETFGAAVGSLIAGFCLIPALGIGLSQLIVVVLCGLAAILAWCFRVDRNELVPASQRVGMSNRRLNQAVLLTAIALAGLSSIGVEIVWQRLFVLLFGSDTQSFAVVAATYLVGISMGAVISRQLIGLIDQFLWAYITTLVCIATAVVAATLVLTQLTSEASSLFFANEWFYSNPVLFRLTSASLILIVPTTLIGMALPLAVEFCGANSEAGAVGRVYAASLLGNVFGLLGTGYIISIGNGLRVTVLILSCFALLAAGIALTQLGLRFNKKAWQWKTLGVSALLLWIAVSISLANSKLPLGVDLNNWNLDYYSEGRINVVAVVSNKDNEKHRQMIIDGVSIGESGGGVDEKQKMLAHLPFLVRKDVDDRKVITIGLGTGILAGVLAENAEVASVTCIELSPSVISACELFSDDNGNVTHRENVTIECADGIDYLSELQGKVDVIVSDAKSRPGHAGNVAFFARDYYEICRNKLSDDGIFVQWLSLETAAESVKTILTSFDGSFEIGCVAVAPPDSIYLVGGREALDLSPEHLKQYLSKCIELRRYGWKSAHDIQSLGLLDQNTFDFNESFVNSFDRPILELFALQSSGSTPDAHKLSNLQWFEEMLANCDVKHSDSAGISKRIDVLKELIEASILMLERPEHWLDLAGKHAKRARQIYPELNRHEFVADLYRQLAAKANSTSDQATRFSALLNVSEMKLSTAAEDLILGMILQDEKQSEQSLNFFHSAAKKAPDDVEIQIAFGFALLDAGKNRQAAIRFKSLTTKHPGTPIALMGLGVSQLQIGESDSGWQNIRKALKVDPKLQSLLSKYQ